MKAWKRPKPKARKMLESRIEETCRQHALGLGWISRKMNGFGFRAWPDRLFLPPKSKTGARLFERFWVEFKKLGEEATEEQTRIHEELRARGETVYVCDSKEKFIGILYDHSNP